MRKVSRKLRKVLDQRLMQPEESFHGLGNTRTVDGRPHTFIDNGANILGVAHLDFVDTKSGSPTWRGQKVVSNRLDDRLGVWTLLDLLPALGCPKFDILLTTDEEIGRSTASDFTATKDYNWIFQFDRRGMEAVMYDYETKKTAKMCRKHGWKVGMGSFSDVCYLEHLGVKGFNFGTGYHNEHTAGCYANLTDTLTSAKRFLSFCEDYKDTVMAHVPVTYDRWSYSGYSSYTSKSKTKTKSKSKGTTRKFSSYDYNDNYYRSESVHDIPLDCGECYAAVDLDWNYCPYCGNALHVWDTKLDDDDSSIILG